MSTNPSKPCSRLPRLSGWWTRITRFASYSSFTRERYDCGGQTVSGRLCIPQLRHPTQSQLRQTRIHRLGLRRRGTHNKLHLLHPRNLLPSLRATPIISYKPNIHDLRAGSRPHNALPQLLRLQSRHTPPHSRHARTA